MAQNTTSTPEQRENRVLLTAMGIVVLLCIVLAIVGFCLLSHPDEIVEGQAEATSVKISGKLPGRVRDFYVHEGDMVKAGDTLIHIHSSLAEAQLMQAQGMETAASAINQKVDAGARIQMIQAAQDMVAQASAAVTITRKTYDRLENLFKAGVVSEQKRDEAKAAYDAAVAAESAAKSQLSLVKEGAQKEDKANAEAMVEVARGGVAQVESLLEDQYLLAPCDGQIDQIYPEEGELVALGAPLMSLLKVSDKWVTFNVREDLLNDLKIGDEIEVMVPALDRRNIKVKIFYVRDLGSYATWRATKSTGQWDSKTFEVKARPVEDQPDLRPGMSVVYFKK
ncbi:MAG: HlyD family efflux transporter periplasmic adaptor subunit [Bacteroides sp.]|nr:HlyD family efflux transporter periplasmic adaptor subunit [Bacteroidales bacterium]MBD5253835.1 HlyD family efflux transporter periplasmic adaptor subunit [Barnesiella sp.]MBD5345307.1 HlyD family efflux transporter periplasmic adaptor subunit [Bacteroides sp.]MBD5367837.1 HlyD family efflux transporter periplasmic adaptor subunit [Bacteroides sp.]MDE5829618.1 efflux RND transporter periplasmic adaptor subunit [Duncaniella sp.]